MSSELEKSGIRVAVGDSSVTECPQWRPPYQTGKTVHVHTKHYKHNKGRRMAPGVCGNGSVPLSHSANVVMRIGIHTQLHYKVTGHHKFEGMGILGQGGVKCGRAPIFAGRALCPSKTA